MAWEDGFVYPFYLLVIGAGFSVGVGTWLSHWFESRRKKRDIEVENRRKEMEIKVDIASKMAEAIAHQAANAITAVSRKKKKLDDMEIDAHYKDVQEWFTQVNAIRLKLESYFPATPVVGIPTTGVAGKWHKYFNVLFAFSSISRYYFYEEPREDQKRGFKPNLQEIKDYFSRNLLKNNDTIDWNRFTTETTYDEKLWDNVFSGLMHRGDDIMKEVLKLPIKVL